MVITDRSSMFDEKRLEELVREKEKNAAVSNGRVHTTVKDVKQSMTMEMDRFTTRKEDYQPERNVVVKTIQVNDSVDKLRAERERKEREENYKKRMEQIRKMYSRDKREDKYNQDYSYCCVC